MRTPRVAIMGAGVAGLTCAHELERLGLRPVIYEISRCVGHPFPHEGAVLEILFRSITTQDLIEFIRLNYGIRLTLPRKVRKITHVSAHNRSTIHGNLGYFATRGQSGDSIENQIARQLKNTMILFDQDPDWRQLASEYDYLVIATARKDIPAALGLWKQLVTGFIIGGMVLGEFDEDSLTVWLNTDYTNKGYAYLAPYGSRRASLILAVADADSRNLPVWWEKFRRMEKIDLKVVEQFQTTLSAGLVFPHRISNVLFAGVSGGFLDPLLGVGAVPAIVSGVVAARSIVHGLDYDKELAFLSGLLRKISRVRQAFARLDNAGIDRLTGILGLPGVQHLVYRTKLDIVECACLLSKLTW